MAFGRANIATSLSKSLSMPITGRTQGLSFLFADGTEGIWYDIAPQYAYQDSAGTTAASVGDPVGKLLDRSGNGHHATQSTAASRPILRQDEAGRYYLEFDGVDDYLSTSAIDFTATDKMFVCAGLRKESDAATGMAVELSANSGSNDGTFSVAAPWSSTYEIGSRVRGTANSDSIVDDASYAAPFSAVVGRIATIGAASNFLRVNGVEVENTGSTGTGNFGNHPLYIGMRGGSSLPFSGRAYSLVVAGMQPTDGEVSCTEVYAAKRAGVTLA